MTWETIQQLIRIAMFSIGGIVLGTGVTDGVEFQALVGGVISIGSFAWWWFWERHRD